MQSPSVPFWACSEAELLRQLNSSQTGLTIAEAERRAVEHAGDGLLGPKGANPVWILLAQFRSPISLMLIFAAVLSIVLGDATDAVIILFIVGASALLSFWQEWVAADALAKLTASISTKGRVLRDGAEQDVLLEAIVPGDIVLLAAGDKVPGDCRLLVGRDLSVDEATLTGETFPVDKEPGTLAADVPQARRTCALFLGTHVVSGTGQALVVHVGAASEFGNLAARLQTRPPEPEFERGVRRFGYFLIELTLVLLVVIFAVNVLLKRSVLDSFLFALALGVGLTPQLLPAIITVNLAYGSRRMAQRGVIVRRLASIENLGSMDVLCSDKTGTLTEGRMEVCATVDSEGNAWQRVAELAFVNAALETGYPNPIDVAIRDTLKTDLTQYEKLDEIPFDFIRKRLTILVAQGNERLMITKGSLANVLAACSTVATPAGETVPLAARRQSIDALFHQFSSQGLRVIAIATRLVQGKSLVSRDDETDMTLVGFLALRDPPKPHVDQTLSRLRAQGVRVKLVTGDNRLVAAELAKQVGIANEPLVTGEDLRQISDAALAHRVQDADVFAEIEPNQKERIILALRKAGHVVGYLGDGINDVTAMHAADLGISVDQAVDVAKEAADLVLLKRDLGVLSAGIEEGRRTFANTLKYVFMASSANFGNMFSMAAASLFLPFLPLLPKQVLLINLLTDLPEMTIARDYVDEELVERPRRWDLQFIRRFMFTFGPLSSVFDFLTFAMLLVLPGVSEAEFRAAWFVESIVSASLIVLVIRTRRPMWKSRPSRALAGATAIVVATAIALPYSPLASFLGFAPLGSRVALFVAAIVALYVGSAEVAKSYFYAWADRTHLPAEGH